MFSEKYQGLRIVVSNAAILELIKEGKTLVDIVEILETGYDAPRKRKIGTIEKWLDKGNKTFNAVVVGDYNNFNKENVWVLIHFGKFSRGSK
tara:strand:+ start:14361 stop:14636 length:276 start_codon:yes stop_codon:yes gene_type:complete